MCRPLGEHLPRFQRWSRGIGGLLAAQLPGLPENDQGAPDPERALVPSCSAYLKTSLTFSPACLRLPLA